MAKQPAYPPEIKDEALKLYREQGPTAAAKALGVNKSTVTRWAQAAGVSTVATSRTRAATVARSVDLKARRQELTELLLEDAHKLRSQLWEPTTIYNFGGKDNDYNEQSVDEPPFVDKKNIMSSVGMAVDRVIKLEALNQSNTDHSAVDSWLDHIAGGDGSAEE